MDHTSFRVIVRYAFAIILFFNYLFLSAIKDINTQVLFLPYSILISTGCIIIFITYIYLSDTHIPNWEIIIWACIYRLIFIFDQPMLSDDIYRYIWDGIQISMGLNPYWAAPLVAAKTANIPFEIQAEIIKSINHPWLVTIYPPGAQGIFFLGALISHKPWGIKLLLTVLDIMTVTLLLRLIPHKREFSILYAWHPLPIIEIAQSGHIDGAMTFFLILSLLFLKRGLIPAAGLMFGISIIIKLTTLVLLPIFIMSIPRNRARLLYLSVLSITIMVSGYFFWPDFKNFLPTLAVYLTKWEFSGFLYQTLKSFMDKMNARIFLLIIFIIGYLVILRYKKNLYLRIIMILLLFLLTQPTLYPWYAIPFATMMVFTQCIGCMPFLWALFFSYSVLIPYRLYGYWREDPCFTALIFAAGLSCLLLLSYKNRPHRQN